MTIVEELKQLREENEVLRKKCQSTYCVGCGFTVEVADQEEATRQIFEHISSCRQHPLGKANEQIGILLRENAELQKKVSGYSSLPEAFDGKAVDKP